MQILRPLQDQLPKGGMSRLVAVGIALTLLSSACSDEAPTEQSTGTASADIDNKEATPSTGEPRDSWANQNYHLMPIAEVDEPTTVTTRDGSPHLWIAERPGIVRRIDLSDVEEAKDPSSPITIQLANDAVLDISDRVGVDSEGGLLGIAFSPDGTDLYVSYTNRDGNSVLSEFNMEGDVAATDERIVFEANQPFGNHNGGHISFGPDGLLYLGLGDGGSGGDPDGNGQDLATYLGSILRLDPTPTADKPYTVPDDNPFTEASGHTSDAKPEIWVYGLRNPWKFSFDPETGDLWIGDVGQDRFEEIDFLPAEPGGAGRGANLGWNSYEGEQSFSGASEPDGHRTPLFTYETTQDQCSVIGGGVYRGDVIQPLQGVYIFADYCGASLVGIEQANGKVVTTAPLTLDRSVDQVIALGRGPAGETYVAEQGGQISRLALLAGGADSVA